MSQLIDNLNTIESIKTDIKSAIENKGVDMTGVSFGSYADKIGEISGGGGVNPSGTLEISENGVYNVYSYSSASVDVHPSASLSETYISNGDYNITGEFNGGVITVDVPAPQFITETLNVSENGTYNPGEGVDGYSKVVVDVPQRVTGFTEKEITEGIQIVNLSNSASYVSPNVFAKNKYIQTVYLPNCTSVGENAFASCSNLSSIYLPNCEYIGSSVFYICSSLTQVNLPMCSYIGRGAFGYCSSLSIITIGYSSICSLVTSAALSNTQITSSTGSIYVPASLVDSYKSAKNWSYFSTQIFPIE